MPLVSSIDYISKRIYLDASTVGASIDTIDIYKEVRALRNTTPSHRNFKPMIVSGGNEQKTPTSFTPKFVKLLYGCRIVPYDTSHTLTLTRETFTDDNLAGVEVFDLGPLAPTTQVNIREQVPQVEVVIVETGVSGLTTPESEKLMALDTTNLDAPVSGIVDGVWAKVLP